MPIFVYDIFEDNKPTGEILEVEQSLNDKPLEIHPFTKQKLKRRLNNPNLITEYTSQKEKKLTDPNYVSSKGFTKYERDKNSGNYYKISGGTGPEQIIK